MPRRHLAQLILTNAASVEHPSDSRQTHQFAHLPDLLAAFLHLVEYDCGEPALAALGSKITAALETFAAAQLNPSHASLALEDLAVGFESFLKKLAVLRYGHDPLRLRGDSNRYKGLLETALGGLLEGKVAKVNARDTSVPILRAPIVSFSYAGKTVRDGVYARTRNLRNEVHGTPARSLFESLRLFRFALAGYLFAVEENLPLVRRHVDPLFRHMQRLSQEFSKWQTHYIELSGEHRPTSALTQEPELIALEWRDGPIDTALQSGERLTPPEPTRERVRALPSTYPRFWLIGEPGAGKTTTLQALASGFVAEALATGILQAACPVFLRAALYAHSVSLERMIARQLQLPVDAVEELLEAGDLHLLIDGMNELPNSEADAGYAAVERLLSSYPDTPCILTSRKFGFLQRFGLPVFELLPLTDSEILDYLRRHLGEQAAQSLFHELERGRGLLLELARNPLMLSMITLISQDGSCPTNRGHLFRLFTKWILNREAKRSTYEADLKEHVLSAIAYRLRRAGILYAAKPLVLDWVKASLVDVRSGADVMVLLTELVDNHLLEVGLDEAVRFPHEMILEYFCARRLHEMHLTGASRVAEAHTGNAWREPLVMCSGLLSDADAFVRDIMARDLLLASQCIASGARVSDAIVATLVKRATVSLAQNRQEGRAACAALLDLGSDDALRVVVKTRQVDQHFEAALRLCDRPEVVALRLLRFGLTGRHRIYVCLKAISRSWSSVSLLESDEIAAAQIALLEGSPDSRELSLIARMGLSPKAIDAAVATVSALRTTPLDSKRWRSYVALSCARNCPQAARDTVAGVLLAADPQTADEEVSVLLAIKAAGAGHVQLRDLARRRAIVCLQKKFFGVAAKFVRSFRLAEDIPLEALVPCLEELAADGRLALVLDFAETFSAHDCAPFVEQAADILLSRGTLEPIMQCRDRLVPTLSNRAELVSAAIARLSPDSPCRSPRALIKFVTVAGLEKAFQGIGVISSWFRGRNFGFMRVVSTGEVLYSHRSCFGQGGRVPRVGELFHYEAVPPRPGKAHRQVASARMVS